MTKTHKLLYAATVFAAVCGVVCGLVRCGDIFADGYRAFYITAFICASFIAAAAYLTGKQSHADGREGLTAFESPDAPLKCADSYTPVLTFGLLLGAGLAAISAVRGFVTRTDLLSTVNALFVFVCAFTLAVRALNKEQGEKTGIFSVFPIYYLCMYLLMFYRDNAIGSDIDVYGPQTITLSVLIFAAYFNAAVKFDSRPAFFRFYTALLGICLWVSELTGYIALRSSLTCTDPAFFLTMTGGFAVYCLCSLYALPLRLFKIKKKKKSDEAPSDSDSPAEVPAENCQN